MEINDADRRRVAKRMREIMEKTPDIYLDRLCLNALRDSLDEGGPIGETLAKLVDRPTCRNEEDGYGRSFLCSTCGYEAWTYDDSCCDPKDFSFCPSCGARVVGE